MLALVLAAALIAQGALGAPTDCGELCEGSTGGYGQSSGSYRSYSKQSSYGSHQAYSSGSRGLGSSGSRLENLDENAVLGLERPGSWHDEKHYVTDDGKGEMNYEAGQTVTNNGYSKFASHSYRYGSHDSHAPLSNSQVLSTSEFNRELQNIRSRISSFMGSFDLSSKMDHDFLLDFKSKASLISSQLNDVCNQVDVGSSMYQQMQQVMQQFQRQVEERQRQIEATVSASSSHGSVVHSYPVSRRPAPVQQRPDDNAIYIQQQQQQQQLQQQEQQQHVQQEIVKVENLLSSFYSTFNRLDTDVKFQEDLNSQVSLIGSKLAELNLQAVQNESERARIAHMKSRFDSYVAQVRSRIEELVKRNQEEEAKRQQRLREIEQERIRVENVEKQRQLLLQQENERLVQQRNEAEQQRLEKERLSREEEAENRKRLQRLEEERLRIQQAELLAEQQRRESERLQTQLGQLSQQQQQIELLQTSRPQLSGSLQVSGSSSIQHSVTGSYGSSGSVGSTGSYGSVGAPGASYARPQPVAPQPHVDLTAAMSRLQQDLNRLQNEVNHFNMYTMRLTAANSASVVSEAEQKAQQLRQSLQNLCESSTRYDNQSILSSAERLQSQFEELFRSFQSQAAGYGSSSNSEFSASGGYSASSSYGSSAKYGAVRQPKIGSLEYTHQKSTDVEIGSSSRPVHHSYSSGSGYSRSSGYSAYGAGVDGTFGSGLIDLGGGSSSAGTDCVEQLSGQPCIRQARRYRRSTGDYGPIYDDPGFKEFLEPHAPFNQYANKESSEYDKYRTGLLRYLDYNRRLLPSHYQVTQQNTADLNQQHVEYGQNEELDLLQKPRGQDEDVFSNRQSTIQSGSIHGSTDKSDNFTLQNSSDFSIGSIQNSQQAKPIRSYEHLGAQGFTHQYSGFNNYQEQNDKVQSFGNLQINQQSEVLPSQENIFANSAIRNQRLEKLDNLEDSDLTQQIAGQIDFGLESQVGRGFSQDVSKPDRYSSYSQNNFQQPQNLQVGQTSEHSTGKYIEILSQQNHKPFDSVQESGFDSSRYVQNGNSQTERSYTSTENQRSISTIRPTVRPAPKPVPRYSRPWQVSPNIPKQPINDLRFVKNQTTSNDQSSTPKNVEPLRGDLPGISETTSTTPLYYENIPVTNENIPVTSENIPVTSENIPVTSENIPVISERPSIIPKPNNNLDFGQQHEQIDLNINSRYHDSQNSRDDWIQNNNESNQYNGIYHYNQHHSFHHNYSYSQNSNYFSQQGSTTDLGQAIQNPLSHLETQSQSTGFGQDQQSMYKFYENQSSHSKFEQLSSTNSDLKPINFENIQLSESTNQNVFSQQTQLPLYEQSSQFEFDRQQETSQKSVNLYGAGIMPLDDTRPLNTWLQAEPSSTTPGTFWKKIGQSVSNTYGKAKEKAKSIFG